MEAQTLTRVAFYDGDLESAMREFNSKSGFISLGRRDVVKFGLYEDKEDVPYFMMASNSLVKVPDRDYDLILTVTSDYARKNQEVADRFEKVVRVKLTEAPEELARMMQFLGLTFQVFKKHGQAAMDLLKSFDIESLINN